MSEINNVTIIIFGMSGDLSKRKLIPALYKLIQKKKLEKCAIIGIGLEKQTVHEILESTKKFITDFDNYYWDRLISVSQYYSLNIKNRDNFKNLKQVILEVEKKFELSGKRLVYCAVGSEFYIDITKNLVDSKIMQKQNEAVEIWNRIVYEKPFGYNARSAKKINKNILLILNESQIFRIDHYLAKEIVENITFVRFTNRVFEPLWNRHEIDHVQIILDETVGLENRSKYYDKYGALKDVVQNHMLQLLALVAMGAPKKLTGNDIRDSKAIILKKIAFVDGIFGQYIGYHDEPDIKSDSKTDTFVALKFIINSSRWKNVPFYLKTGKCLDNKSTKIVIKFKQTDCLLLTNCPVGSNYLTISIYPKEGFTLELNTKKPRVLNDVIKSKMDFCYDCLFGPDEPQAYESIIMDIIHGEKAVSVRQDEIEYSWKIIDKIKNLSLYSYEKGTNGPKEADEFAKKHGFEWR